MTEPSFPRAASQGPGRDPERVSLSLENLGHQFGLLSGAQSHESRADVVLTIELAKLYKERFKADIRTFEPFEGLQGQVKPSRGMVRWMVVPDYAIKAPKSSINLPMVLLDFDHRSSLWVDLKRFETGAGRKSISWFNHSGGHLFVVGEQEPLSPAEQAMINRALEEFKDVTLKNFFSPSTCDIEQDIYRLDFDDIAALEAAIWQGKDQAIKNSPHRDAKVVLMRQQIAAAPLDKPLSSTLEKRLAQYAGYRYGGGAQLVKTLPAEPLSKEQRIEAFHLTLDDLRNEIAQLNKQVTDAESKKLLSSLSTFIDQSDIAKLLSRASSQKVGNQS